MKKCPTCNAEFGDGATYCDKCGSKLVKYATCPHCGASVDEDAVYCSYCGKAISSTRVAASFIDQSSSNNKVDDATIERYKREIVSLKSKRTTFLTLGLIFLPVGLALCILFIALGVRTVDVADPGYGVVSQYVMYVFLGVLFELVADAGIVFLILSGAVFSKKISNRERIIEEYESNR